MPEAYTAHATRPGMTAALWFGILAGPLAALVMLQVDYMIVPAACNWTPQILAVVALHLVPVLLLGLTVLAGVMAWRHLARDARGSRGDHRGHDAGDVDGRNHFMAQVGVGTSALFVLVLLAEWVPVFIIHPCQYV